MIATAVVPAPEATMLYEFKSKATGTVTMTGAVAERLLRIVGKEPGAKGIFTVEQMPDAIAALQAAIDREKREPTPEANEDDDERDDARPATVSLAQRAWPLIDMMRDAHKAGQPITWGV